MRWRLTAAHYLNVPGGEVEFKEVSRESGKQARKVYPVPTLLNPDDGADCNYQGEIIVCQEGKGLPKDIVFINGDGSPGEPTPDMEPLDDEAQALSDSLRHKWTHPIETLPSTMSPGEEAFMKAMMAAAAGHAASAKGVDPAAFEALQQQVKALMEQNTQLKAAAEAKPATARRA